MSRHDFDSFAVGTAGTTVTTSGSSASVVVPNAANGSPAKFVRIAATGACYIKFGPAAVVATTSDILIMGQYPEVYNVIGVAKIAYLQQTGAQTLNIIPLEC